ncbi:MAG: hypothetical protein ABIN08_24745 [Caldimonas sp.]
MTTIDVELVYHSQSSNPAVFAGGRMFDSVADLIAAHPSLITEGDVAAGALAVVYNHFARGDAYEVITEPSAFESAYRASAANENSQTAWSQTSVRLTDFGMPEFDRIHVPFLAGMQIAFFARDALTGLAYEVGGSLDAPAEATYEPMRLLAFD